MSIQKAKFLGASIGSFFVLSGGDLLVSDNWIVANLEDAFATWNEKMTEIWSLVTTSPQSFKGGAVWNVIEHISGGLQAIGYGLLVLFFAMAVFKSTASFRDFQRPEYALKHFIRFVAAKVAITYSLDLMVAIYDICGGIVQQIAGSLGGIDAISVSLPAAVESAVENAGFWASIPLWLVTILGSLFIMVMSFIMIMTVYGRFFKLAMYTALAPVPLSSFAGEGTSQIGKSFVRSYIGVCMEGAVIILSCVIFSAFASVSEPTLDTSITTVTMIWKYLGEVIFNMLVLVGMVKGADRIVKEMLGT